MLAETERMLTKHRMNENNTIQKKRKNDIGTGRKDEEKRTGNPKTREELIQDLWNENQERFIYNPLKGSVNFNKARPTDYILNKHTNLPKPLEMEKEIDC